MNVLHINPGYPFTTLYQRMLDSFSDRHSHCVYVPMAFSRALPSASDLACDPRIIYSRDYHGVERVFLRRKSRRIAERLQSQMKVNDFNVVHGHFLFSAGSVAHLLKSEFGIGYVVSVRNTDVNIFFRYGIHLRNAGLRIMEHSKGIVFINPSYRDIVLERYVPKRMRDEIAARSHVLPNGIDAFWHVQSNGEGRVVRPGRVSLLFVGTFTRNKNVGTVVEVAKILHNRGFDVRLELVGDGPEYPNIQRQVAGKEYIHLWGRITSKKRLLELYRGADVFVMPSHRETFGLVYVEAMSQGVPVIYTKGQGIDGYFPDGMVGYAVDPYRPVMIADRVTDILRNYPAISTNCVDASRQFSWEGITVRLEELYEAV